MDYDKIGNFISLKRKEKNFTQNDLAQKLGVTDRAVSKWERGVGCPDVSLLEPLSEILEVSILEILHGENLEDVKDENKVILQVLKNTNKYNKIWKIVSIVFLNMLLVVLSIFSIVCLLPSVLDEQTLSMMHVVTTDEIRPNLKFLDLAFFEEVDDFDNINVGNIVYYEVSDKLHGTFTIIDRVISKKNGENIKESFEFEHNNNVWNESNNFNLEIRGKLSFKIPFVGAILYGYETGTDTSLVAVSVLLMIGALSILFIDIVLFESSRRERILRA